MLTQWLWSYGCNSHFFKKIVVLSIFHDVLCFSHFFPQILHLDIQPDHHSIRISMLYKKNGLLNTLLKLFGRFRGAKRHVRQNHDFLPFFLKIRIISTMICILICKKVSKNKLKRFFLSTLP